MKKKAIICSILSIILCISMTVGSAFALFTSKDEADVLITAGNVDMTVTVDTPQLTSTLGALLPETSVTYEGNRIIINRMVPGDVISFHLRIKNNSNVTVKYRTIVKQLSDTGLWDGLVVTIGNAVYLGDERVSTWTEASPASEDVLVPVTISLPESADNRYCSKSCSFAYVVEAVQGNANVYGQRIANGLYYDAANHIYSIENAAGLQYFASLATNENDFAGERVDLLNDIDLGGILWTPIAAFGGELNGNGKTIRNFKINIDENNQYGGFFNLIKGGTGERVHDLTLKDVTATVADGRFGVLANSVQGIVNRVTVENVNVTTTSEDAWVGGMCAFVFWGCLNNCTVNNLEVNAEAGACFVAGFAPVIQQNDDRVFNNCHVNGFRVTIESTTGAQVGGFAGQTQRGWDFPKLTNCTVTGIDIVGSGYLNIGGFIANPGAHTTVENCSTQGKIDAYGVTSGYSGGFLADLGWNDNLGQKGGHKITNCTADVDIGTRTTSAGGFVGSATNSNDRTMPATFTNCVVNGDITVTGTGYAGGFAGDADRGTYNNCTVNGTVAGVAASGDNFFGHVHEDNNIVINNGT